MRKTYEPKPEVTLDEADVQKAIQVAQRHYRATGGAQLPLDDDGKTWREIPAEEFVADEIDAIMELLHGDGLCEQAGIEVVSISCTGAGHGEASVKDRESGDATHRKRRLSEGNVRNAVSQGTSKSVLYTRENQRSARWFIASLFLPRQFPRVPPDELLS